MLLRQSLALYKIFASSSRISFPEKIPSQFYQLYKNDDFLKNQI